MPLKTNTITVKPLRHRGAEHIGLFFSRDFAIIDRIKTLPGRKYSKTHGCWYLPKTTAAYRAFLALGLTYQIEKSGTDKADTAEMNTRGTVGSASTTRLTTAIAPQTVRPPKTVASEDTATSDIAPARVGHVQVHFNNKVFVIKTPFHEETVQKIKSFKRAWWNDKLKAWLVYGSFENLTALHTWLNCWTPLQLEQIQELIGVYEAPKKLVFYNLPDERDRIAVELTGFGVNPALLKKIPS